MAARTPSTFKVPAAFWSGAEKLGLSPAAVLSRAQLPVTLYRGDRSSVTATEYFRLWRAVDELAEDPTAGLHFAGRLEIGQLSPSRVAGFHARNYGDAINRMARYKLLCTPEEMRLRESKGEITVEFAWKDVGEEPPPILTDASLGAVIDLGRRGTQTAVRPKRVELRRSAGVRAHEAYFKCPITTRAPRNLLVLDRADLELPFVAYNEELLAMLQPSLDRALVAKGQPRGSTTSEQVKWILKGLLAGSTPDVARVARELGVSERTLQRRIRDEKGSFRDLLQNARLELAHRYLLDPSMEIKEVAFLLGYEDANSFYRAFQTWEGQSPAEWRTRRQSKN